MDPPASRRFRSLVLRLGNEAKRDPKRYRRGVASFMLVGYLGLYGVAASLLAAALALVWRCLEGDGFTLANVRVWGPAPLLVGLALAWLRVSASRPTGIELSRVEAPRLFAMVDKLAADLGVAPPDRVLLTPEMNAAVVHTPGYGMFRRASDLLLGVPLLLASTPDQLRAVVAHELGHLGGGHARFSARVYALELSWSRIQAAGDLAPGPWTPLAAFARWYGPRLAARSLAARREQELEADRLAASVVGVEACAEALAALELRARWLHERFLRDLLTDRCRRDQGPPGDLHQRLREALREPLSEARAWLTTALARRAEPDDPHPPLARRLRALGHTPEPARLAAPAAPLSAAEAYLGPRLDEMLSRMDAVFLEHVTPLWEARRAEVRRARLDLELVARREPERDRLWTRALLLRALGDDRAALVALRELLVLAEDVPEVSLVVGEILERTGDERCVPFLEAAAERPRYAVAALERALKWAHDHDAAAVAERVAARLAVAKRDADAAEDERGWLDGGARFAPAELDERALDYLRVELGAVEPLRGAWVARREVERFAEHPCHLVLLQLDDDPDGDPAALVEALAARLSLSTDVRLLPREQLPRACRARFEQVSSELNLLVPRAEHLPAPAPPGLVAVRSQRVPPKPANPLMLVASTALVASLVVAFAASTRAAPQAPPPPVKLTGVVHAGPATGGIENASSCKITVWRGAAQPCRMEIRCAERMVYAGKPTCALAGRTLLLAVDPRDTRADGNPALSYDRSSLLLQIDERLDREGDETRILLED